ncbi:hypothetical protein Hdeb2414_s0071g00773581 [Helianthus debilis subsp. tardiflorus]
MNHKKESPTMRTKGNNKVSVCVCGGGGGGFAYVSSLAAARNSRRQVLWKEKFYCFYPYFYEQIDPLLRLMLTRAPFKPESVLIRTHFHPNNIEHVFKRPILTHYPN